MQQGLQFVFEAYLDGSANEQSTWEFAVAFALKTLLVQENLAKVDRSLRDILYGSEDATLPPAFLPQDIASAITRLVEFVEVPLDVSMVAEIHMLTQRIYNYLIDGS